MRFALLFLVSILPSFAADGSGSGTDDAIQAWHDLVGTINGDTYTIDAGTYSVDAEIIVTKGVTITGAGIGSTVLTDDALGAHPIIRLDTAAEATYEVSGITFRYGARTTQTEGRNSGATRWLGESSSIVVSNCEFDKLWNKVLTVDDYARGVFANNTVIGRGSNNPIWFFHSTWAGGVWGDKSWSELVDWGGQDAVYIESNTFSAVDNSGNPQSTSLGVTDTYGGARIVIRNNIFNNTHLPTHGTSDGSGRNRGLRQFEVYDNEFNDIGSSNAFHVRGGTGIYMGNVHNNATKTITLHYYRGEGKITGKFGHILTPAGPTEWDTFDLTDTFGTAGDGIFYEGVAAAGSGDLTLVVSGTPWTPNEWIGYSVFVPASAGHPDGYWDSSVISNTSNTITVEGNNHSSNPHVFVDGEAFEIWRLVFGLDTIGAGTSDLMTDTSSTPVPENLNQQRAPAYIFQNTNNGAVHGASPILSEDYHYMLEGNGDTTGVGVGLLSARPASPTLLYAAWWATDAEILYRWNGAQWETYWSKLAYPHPLLDPAIEGNPPTPDPMTFAIAPAAAGPSSIMMTATTASDATPPIQYRVRIDGATETAWQGSESFTISGLTPATSYDFEVRARDSASTPNLTAYSAISSATTDAASARPSASVASATANTLSIAQ